MWTLNRQRLMCTSTKESVKILIINPYHSTIIKGIMRNWAQSGGGLIFCNGPSLASVHSTCNWKDKQFHPSPTNKTLTCIQLDVDSWSHLENLVQVPTYIHAHVDYKTIQSLHIIPCMKKKDATPNQQTICNFTSKSCSCFLMSWFSISHPYTGVNV